MVLEENNYWAMSHNELARAIELDWKAGTSEMAAGDFQEALEHLAGHIRDHGATGTLIDVRSFQFSMTPELERWRVANIIPAYNAGGLRRFAYLLPPGAEYRPGDGGDGADFATEYFHDADAARAWLRDA